MIATFNSWLFNEVLINYVKKILPPKTKFSETEVYNDLDKFFKIAGPGQVVNNKLTISIPAAKDRRHYIGTVVVTGTAGTGGNENFKIKQGYETVWEESFVIGQDKSRQFPFIPLTGNIGESVTFEISATDLTAGKVYIAYYTK